MACDLRMMTAAYRHKLRLDMEVFEKAAMTDRLARYLDEAQEYDKFMYEHTKHCDDCALYCLRHDQIEAAKK